jgi:hypothetical protein
MPHKMLFQKQFKPKIWPMSPQISVATHDFPWHPFPHEDDGGQIKQGRLKTPNRHTRQAIQATAFI